MDVHIGESFLCLVVVDDVFYGFMTEGHEEKTCFGFAVICQDVGEVPEAF